MQLGLWLVKASLFVMALSPSDWRVGDTLNFNMRIKPIPITFNSTLSIVKMEKDEVTMDQIISYKSLKENIETVINKETGEVLHTRINGKEIKTSPSTGAPKIVKEEEAHIKVPAGEFDCVHVVMADEQGTQTESWINPAAIPITGMLKMSAVQEFLTIETELRSFDRGH